MTVPVFYVSAAVSSGATPTAAGALLAAASVVALLVRLALGVITDRSPAAISACARSRSVPRANHREDRTGGSGREQPQPARLRLIAEHRTYAIGWAFAESMAALASIGMLVGDHRMSLAGEAERP